MFEPIEFEGQWWLPDKPDNKIFGICKYNPKSGVELELKDSFFLPMGVDAPREISIIQGLQYDGKSVTLFKCKQSGQRLSVPGMITTTYHAIYMFSGVLFGKESDICFNKITIELYPLAEWVGISGIELSGFSEYPRIDIHYDSPQDIHIDINPDLKLTLRFFPKGFSYNRYQANVRLEQCVVIDFLYSKSIYLNNCLHNIDMLVDFLKFATLTDSYPTSITFFRDDLIREIAEADLEDKIDFYFTSRFKFERTRTIYDHDMLFSRSDIEDTLERILKNWFSKYDSLHQFFILYFSVINKPESYLESKFRSLVSALETYHQSRYQGVYLDNDDYEPIYSRLVKEIPKSLSKAHRDSLANRLKYGNSYSLRSKLKDLFKEHAHVLNIYLMDYNKLLKQIVNTRNYYVHYSEQDKGKALKQADLLHLTNKIQLFIEIIILSEIGFEPTLIIQLFKKNWRHRNYIELFSK